MWARQLVRIPNRCWRSWATTPSESPRCARRACSVEASKGGRSFQALLAGEMQGRLAAAAVVATPLGYQRVTLSGEGEFAVHATAAVDEALDLTAFDFVTVAAMRRQLVDAAHDQL